MTTSEDRPCENLEDYVYEQNAEKRASHIYTVDLSEKHIQQIPELLKKFHSLRCLLLRMNTIIDIGASLKGYTALRELDLSSNSLISTAGFESLKELRSLSLQFNRIEQVEGLGGLKKLQVLQLNNNVNLFVYRIVRCSYLVELIIDVIDLNVIFIRHIPIEIPIHRSETEAFGSTLL